jgi:NAD(P)-dependent dehydrogenase (short-subunit alcohol dehydrogenase family)
MSGGKRVALVSGGNKGIGYEIAKGLAREGFATVLGCRDGSLGEAAAAALRAEGFEHVTSERLDLTDATSWVRGSRIVPMLLLLRPIAPRR